MTLTVTARAAASAQGELPAMGSASGTERRQLGGGGGRSAAGSGTLTRWMVAVGLLVTAWCLVGVPAQATYFNRTTADEPQYLLTAQSLWDDRSLDISDEIADRDYESFHPTRLSRQTQPFDDGREISPHDPLLPALLAVPMGLGGWVAAKATLAALAGVLAASLVWIAVRRFAVPPGAAALTVGCFGVAAPLAAYGTQVYPELPAALAVTAAIGALTGPLQRAGPVVLLVAVVALAWLGVKYVPVAAVVGLLGAIHLGRAGRWRALLALAVAAVGAGAVYLVAHRGLYGGWTVYAAGDHFVDGEAGVIGFEPDYWGRSRRMVGLLVDRGFGLAAWAPLYLLVVPALAALARRRPRGWLALVVPLAAGWFVATFVALTMHGFWWPGRQVVVVLPAVVLAVAWWAARWRPAQVLVAVAGALSVVLWGWLLAEVLLEHRRLIIDMEQTTDPLYRAWRTILPDGRDASVGSQVLTGVWTLVLAGIAALGWRTVAPRGAAGSISIGDGAAGSDVPGVPHGSAAVSAVPNVPNTPNVPNVHPEQGDPRP